MARKILLVEDDQDTRRGLAIRLQASGFEVAIAGDGQAAMSAVQREHPDLILLDLGIPAGDGFLVLERLGRMGAAAGIPVIVVTARASAESRERALGLGARAVLVKPVDNAALLAAIETHLSAATPASGGGPLAERPRVLIVEDDADTRLGLRIRLQASGHDVTLAGDAATALNHALRDHPDVILLDLGLPAGDGLVVLERLKANTKLANIPVIVLSARDPATHAPRALAAGAAAFLQKPADNAELLATIAKALGRA